MIGGGRAASVRRAWLALGASLFLGGCVPDVGTVRFMVPPHLHRFETAGSIRLGAPDLVPAASCVADAECCGALASVAVDCRRVELGCEAQCRMAVRLEDSVPVFLLRAVPDLALLGGEAKRRLAVKSVTVHGRPANAAAPESAVDLYLAPFDTENPRGGRATLLATVAAMSLRGGSTAQASIGAGASAALRRLLEVPTNPFNVIAVARLPLGPGAPVPKGELEVAVQLELETSVAP